MNGAPPAVVVGLDCITGLQTARILARHGIDVIGFAGDRRHFAARTRACKRVLEVDLTSEALVTALEDLGPSLDAKAVLFPCTDLAVLLISEHRARLSPSFHVLLPKHDVVELLMDKVAFCRHALEVDLPIPTTFLLTSRPDAEHAAARLGYPAVVKPPVKTAQWQQHTKAKVFRVDRPKELLDLYDRVHGWTDLLIAQEWVGGGEDALYSCNAYFGVDSRPLATFVARKLRQWPPRTGTSSLGEECRNDVVLAETIRVFEGVGFHGLAYLEMKRDDRTGRHFIIEPNVGRPTGRSAIAEAGGVDLLLTAYCDAAGLPLPTTRVQNYSGVKWLDLRRDLQSAAYFMLQRELTVGQWWSSVRGRKAHAVLSLSDPVPFVLDIAHTVRKGMLSLRRPRR